MIFLIGEFGKVTTKKVVVSCTLCTATTMLKDEESAQDNQVLACNFGKYSSIFTARCYASAVLAMQIFIDFYRAMLCVRSTSHGPVSVCLSVRPSVTSRSSTKTAKRRITQTRPHDSPGTLVF